MSICLRIILTIIADDAVIYFHKTYLFVRSIEKVINQLPDIDNHTNNRLTGFEYNRSNISIEYYRSNNR